MKVAALLSGGKDSCYNMLQCVKHGHQIVCLVNLRPANTSVNELDSYMYQTVGHTAINAISEAMEVPLEQFSISGKCIEMDLNYTPQEGDEVEDLYQALHVVKNKYPEVNAVSSGAILSNYQRERVENVCNRLGLVSLAYLWEREQRSLLHDMIEDGIVARVIKTAAMGLDRRHIGKTLNELEPYLLKISDLYGCNPCGEGGEYETFTVDCPLFKHRIVLDETEIVLHDDNIDAPVLLFVPHTWHLEDKEPDTIDVITHKPQITPPKEPVEYTEDRIDLSGYQGDKENVVVVCKTDDDAKEVLKQWDTKNVNQLLRVIISDAVQSTAVMSTSLPSPRLIAWYSRTHWCPPVLSHYGAISIQGNWISIPTILPIDSETLLNYNISVQEAYDVCQDYKTKLLLKASTRSKAVIECCLTSLRWADSPLSVNACLPVTITGCVDDVIGGCPMQLSVEGYEECSDCQLEVEVQPEKVVATYGTFSRFIVAKEPECSQSGFGADIKQLVEDGFANCSVTIYFEPGCDLDLFSGLDVVLIPVKHLGVSFRGGNIEPTKYLVQVVAFNCYV